MAYGQQAESRKINIHISNISTKTFASGSTKVVLEDGKMKYNFFTLKKDGKPSKAGEAWNTLGLRIGDNIEAEVSETPEIFNDPQTGKSVSYTNRRILFFYTDQAAMETAQQPTPQAQPAQPAPVAAPSSFDMKQQDLAEIHTKLDAILVKADSIYQLMGVRAQANAVLPPKPAPVARVAAPVAPVTPIPEPEIPTINVEEDDKEFKIEDVPF